MTLAAFKIQRPKKEVVVVVRCELQDPHQNGPECKWYWIRLTSRRWEPGHENEPFASELAWVYKDSPEGKRLYELLKDGSEKRLTLLLYATPEGYDGTNPRSLDARQNSITIKKIVYEG
jgi:hypothetical protein